MQNDIFYDYVSGTDGGFSGIYVDANDYVDIYQATVKNCRYGIVEISNSITVKNSIVFECFDDFFGVTTVDRCASDDGDGTNPIDITAGGQDWDDQFTDKDNDDYSIKDFDANIWHSSDLTNADDSDVPLFDIAGTPRPPFFGQDTSVGAFELEFVNPSVMLRRRRYMLEHF